MSYHFLCKRGIRPARTAQILVFFNLKRAVPQGQVDRIWPAGRRLDAPGLGATPVFPITTKLNKPCLRCLFFSKRVKIRNSLERMKSGISEVRLMLNSLAFYVGP